MAPQVLLSIMSYMTCSSLALISNKVTMFYFPTPGLVFCLQLFLTILFICIGKFLGHIAVDPLKVENVKVFVPYICSFVISLYSNGRALAYSNVETIIVFRSCSPLLVSILDWMFLDRELPSARSSAALLGVVVGAIGYVLADSEFAVKGVSAYFWVTCNLCGIVFEMTYGKRLISKVTFSSPVWGSVLYTNALSLCPMFVMAATAGEGHRLGDVEPSAQGLMWLALSCVLGVGISWSGWNCRSRISATAYTLTGVACKFVSVLLNCMLWDRHASPSGLAMLAVCLVCSSAYQQAPVRPRVTGSSPSHRSPSHRSMELERVGFDAIGRCAPESMQEDSEQVRGKQSARAKTMMRTCLLADPFRRKTSAFIYTHTRIWTDKSRYRSSIDISRDT